MFRIALLIKTVISYLNETFIPEAKIAQILQEQRILTKIKQIDYDQVKTKYFSSPLKVFLYLISIFICLSAFLFILQLVFLAITILTPFFNNYVNRTVKDIDTQNKIAGITKICFIFLTFKLLKGFISVIHDSVMQFLAVRMYSLMVSTVTKYCRGFIGSNGNLLTILQDDCENIISIPSAILEVVLKQVEFIFFVIFLLTLIDKNRVVIGVIYFTFFGVNYFIAYKYYQINLNFLKSKQERLTIIEKSDDQIRHYRQKELNSVTNFMIIQVISQNLVDLVNIVVMIIIYSLDEMQGSNKYTIIIIFGMISSSTFGLNSYLNAIALNLNSSRRIILQFNKDREQSPLGPNQQVQAPQTQKNVVTNKSQINFKIIFHALENGSIMFRLLFLFFLSMCFVAYFFYSYAISQLTQKGAASLSPKNVTILAAQFVAPTLFYIFLCVYGFRLSKSIYTRLLQKPQKFRKLDAQSLNKLSGDIRQIDRFFYGSLNQNFTGISKVIALLLFSSIALNSLSLSIIFIIFIFMIVLGFRVLMKKMMLVRRNIYRREARAKGLLIRDLKLKYESADSLQKIHNMKQIGYLIEQAYILFMYIIMAFFVTILMAAALAFSQRIENLPIIIMTLIQLDGNLIEICINWIHYQICMTSTERCLVLLQEFQKQQIENEPLSNQDHPRQSLLTHK